MKYSYNYSFLANWMQANRDITNKQVMRAMGTTSNTCLDNWEHMKSPLPTIALLRFCNAFNVPLSAFIVDADADRNEDGSLCSQDYVCPGDNDQLQPNGGYIANDDKRQLGTRALRDPLDVDCIKSVVPGLTVISPPRKRCNETNEPPHAPMPPQEVAPAELPPQPTASTAGAEQGISLSTLNRMLDIIAEQQKQIGEQQKLIGELTHRLKVQQPGYGMVAEDIHCDCK